MDMGDVLSQCYRFLDECPGEAVVFQFKNDNGKRERAVLRQPVLYLYQGKRALLVLRGSGTHLGRRRGKLVLIRRCKMEPKPDFTRHNTGIDFSTWVEQPEVIPTALPLCTGTADFIIQDRFKYKPKPRWAQVIRPFLEQRTAFGGQYVINYMSTAGGLKGPRRNAKYINAKFMDYPLKKGVYYGTTYVDFPSREQVLKIVETNFE